MSPTLQVCSHSDYWVGMACGIASVLAGFFFARWTQR